MKSFTHLLAAAALLAVIATAAHAGIYSHYSFDTDFTDTSGNGHDGTAVDGNTDTDTDGVSITTTAGEYVFGGGAANFTTERDWVGLPSKTFSSGDDYSIAFWARDLESAGSLTGGMVIGQAGSTGFFVWIDDANGGLRWRSSDGSAARQADFTFTDDAVWHHYAIVAGDFEDADATVDEIRLYRDGAVVGTDDGNSTGFIIDAIGEAYSTAINLDFHGQLDEVWVFDNALTADGVASIYADNLAPVVLTASNGGGTSSFGSALSWDDGNAPSADHNYFTEDHDLRTSETPGDVTFAGNSLSVDTGGRFILKTTGGNTVTVDDLRLNGGQVFNGNGGTTFTLAGNITANDGTTSTFETAGSGRTIIVDAPIGGTGNIATASAGLLVFNGVNTYTGDTTVTASTLNLSSTNEQRFLIENGGVSNSIGGTGSIDLDGLLRLDTSVLTDLVGSWNLIAVDTLTESWGSNFGLAFVGGPTFADLGGGAYGSGGWSFDQSTGTLTLVPTPAALPAGLLLIAAVAARRRRKA